MRPTERVRPVPLEPLRREPAGAVPPRQRVRGPLQPRVEAPPLDQQPLLREVEGPGPLAPQQRVTRVRP